VKLEIPAGLLCPDGRAKVDSLAQIARNERKIRRLRGKQREEI
jgi:hypothetical protein